MTALLLLAQLARADVLHVTLEVHGGEAKLVHAAVTDGDLPSRDGEIAILNDKGEVLATAAFPPLTTQRAVITPQGHDGGPRPSPYARAALPWPEGAARVRIGGTTFTPPIADPRRMPPPPELVPIRQVGPPHRRLDLLVLAEGYREDQRGAFIQAAQRILAHLDALEPYNRYSSLLNVWGAFTPSTDAGIDASETPGSIGSVDTAFECFSGCLLGGVPTDRLICCDEAEILRRVDEIAPFAEGVLVLANTDHYGGSGGFNYSVSFTGPQSEQVAAHELAHSLVLLWDEYSYYIPQPEDRTFISPNCARADGDVPWQAWIDAEHPEIGRFEGCSFTDWVRPTEYGCMMNSLQDTYCPVCREHLIVSMYEAVGGNLVERADPMPGTRIDLDEGGSQTFEIGVLEPPAGLTWSWAFDGEELSQDPYTFTLDGCGNRSGELTLTVSDATDWVRNDPESWLTQTISWPVRTARCEGDPACSGCASPGAPGALGAAALAMLLRRRR